MKRILLILALLFPLGCSTDAPPTNSFPLSLILQDGHRTGGLGLFTLQISKNNVKLQGARLTYRTSPQNVTKTLQGAAHNDVLSDTAGIFKFVLTWDDSTQLMAFQGYTDSLKSNFVVWPN